MITRTSREIIQTAKTLANADNSAFTDFFTNTTVLNNAYRDIYDVLVTHSKAFVNKITVNDDTFLPPDCYTILGVEDKAGNPVHQETFVGTQTSGWRIENNIFKYPKTNFTHTDLTITYATIPATITAPDKWIQVTPAAYTKTNQNAVTYDKSTETVTITEKPSGPISYLGKDLVFDINNQTMTWNGMDFYDYISRQNDDGTDIRFVNVQVDSPYMVISYADGKVYVFTGWQATEWNYNCIYGHETKGEVSALTTDDSTGFGMLFRNADDGKYYYAPFVPDTILSYPNNTLFAYMEYRIAYIFASMLNVNTTFLEKELQKAEDAFYKNVGSTDNVRRISNYHKAKGIFYIR